jgi:hypothetical protein
MEPKILKQLPVQPKKNDIYPIIFIITIHRPIVNILTIRIHIPGPAIMKASGIDPKAF